MFRKKPPAPRDRRSVRPVQNERVFSYHANRSSGASNVGRKESEVAGLNKRRRQRSFKTFRHTALFLCVALLLFVSMRLTGEPRIVASSDDGKSNLFLRSPDSYQQAAAQEFSRLNNSNKITVNTGAIAEHLKRQFPELATVTITLPVVGTAPTVYVQPAAPKLILIVGQEMFIIDKSGRALIDGRQVPDVERLKLPVVTDQSAVATTVGKVVLPGTTVSFITEVAAQLERQQVEATGFTLLPGDSELNVQVRDQPYVGKFNVRGNAREEAGTFLAVKRHLDEQNKKPAAYIDVRVPGRAFYK